MSTSIKGHIRQAILQRDAYTCQYCGVVEDAGNLHIDHVIARSQGGVSRSYNLTTACRSCNRSKGIQTARPHNLDQITAGYPAWRAKIEEMTRHPTLPPRYRGRGMQASIQVRHTAGGGRLARQLSQRRKSDLVRQLVEQQHERVSLHNQIQTVTKQRDALRRELRQLQASVKALRHYHANTCAFYTPAARCDCGADETNAAIDRLLGVGEG